MVLAPSTQLPAMYTGSIWEAVSSKAALEVNMAIKGLGTAIMSNAPTSEKPVPTIRKILNALRTRSNFPAP